MLAGHTHHTGVHVVLCGWLNALVEEIVDALADAFELVLGSVRRWAKLFYTVLGVAALH